MVIAFDIDDTLVKEREFCISAFKELSDEYLDEFPDGRVFEVMRDALFRRENHYDAVEKLFREKGIFTGKPEDAEKEKAYMCWFVNRCRYHFPNFSLHTRLRAVNMIEDAKDLGHIPAIITDGRSVTQRDKLKALAIYDKIDPRDIFISEERRSNKTEKTMFEMLMAQHPEADGFVYVGDNTAKDFYWPKKLGWKTVGILDRDDTNIHPQALNADPEHRPDLWETDTWPASELMGIK